MYSNNKEIRDVADVAARIMAGLPPLQEKLHPNQQKIDVHEPEKDELTADDFKKLRAGKKPDVKKEEVEQIDELSTSTLKSYISGAQKDRASQSDSKNSGDKAEADYAKKQIVKRTSGIVDAKSRMSKEEVEQQDEAMSHQAKTTMKHIPNASPALKQAAKDIKPGVGGYRDRIAMLKAGGVKEEVEDLNESDIENGYKIRMKHIDKGRIHSPSGEHVATVTREHGEGWRYHSGNKNWDGLETSKHYKTGVEKTKAAAAKKAVQAHMNEQVELDEVKMADLPSTKVQGRSYGSSKPQPSAFDVLKGPKDKELKSIESEKKKKKMSEMVALYKEGGMKAFFESIKKEDLISEEPDSEQFAKELEDQKKRAAGTKPQAAVAKASVQAVKNESIEITDEMIFEVLENAGIDFETLSDDELQIAANEAYEILDELSTKTLAKAASAASDPDSDYHYGKSHDPQKFADHAKKTKDAKSAAAVQGAADAKGHYTRPGHTIGSYDKLAHRTPARVTSAGKANKQDVNRLKSNIQRNEATEQDIYVIDADLANGVNQANIEERMMTEPEKQKKEEMVKSMKKGLAGFKERYGDRAKNVMYATATKNAMKD
jgi:hypothetical protein